MIFEGKRNRKAPSIAGEVVVVDIVVVVAVIGGGGNSGSGGGGGDHKKSFKRKCSTQSQINQSDLVTIRFAFTVVSWSASAFDQSNSQDVRQ